MNKQNPNLVVCITTYNRRQLLERTLQSVFSQSYPHYRIVIVNDESSDGTKEYLDALNDPRITVVHHEKNRGYQAARNSGMKQVKEGEWAILFDDDDIFLPNAFMKIAKAISEIAPDTEVIQFSTLFRTNTEEFIGGYQFKAGETQHMMSYLEMVAGGTHRGDAREVLKWSVCMRYKYAEDVIAPDEFSMLLARDGVVTRCVPETIAFMDASVGEHMHKKRSHKMIAGWTLAHRRFFRDHKKFVIEYPEIALSRSIAAAKSAIRSYNPMYLLYFIYQGTMACVRLINPWRKRK